MEVLGFGRQAWASFEAGAALEWLETNGLGGWAYGTVVGANTRFYHAVLAPAMRPPAERLVLLARLEEAVLLDGVRCPLYTNQWASGHTEVDGLVGLQRFALAPFPTWTYAIGDLLVEKRLFMRHGQNCTVIRYRVRCSRTVTLMLSPLVTCRSIHAVLRANDWPFAQERLAPASVAIEPYVGSPRLYLTCDGGAWEPGGAWVYGLAYPYERLRGEAEVEDLYRPGAFRWECPAGGGELTFVASVSPLDRVEGAAWEAAERVRRERLVALSGAASGAMQQLVLAADQFIVQRASIGRATVIAGYPWFTDWGRDTMIALPGLALATGRHDLARELLQTFAAYERDGLIPNHFPEYGAEPLYNTADASLWFFEAAWRYLAATGDLAFVREQLYPVMVRIAEAHLRGTRFAIGVDAADGLLRCGHPAVQVTWMDAKVGDWVVTPRDGKPVEIQALWYNGLRVLAQLGEAERWARHADAVQAGFARFWNPAAGCLYDLIRPDGSPDPAIRPNQLFALTLSHPLLAGERAKGVVDVALRELYTPYGLRSLGRGESGYAGRYVGSRLERDAVYHQGTVWAWLIGPFVRAYLQAYGRGPAQLARAREFVAGLLGHLTEFGVGSVAEIFDGDPPHTPRGCVAQAWSVAELLWLLREEGLDS